MSTLFFAAAIVGALFACETVENVKSKDEYGILQVVEYESRRSPISVVEIIEKNGYWVAGFRAVSGDRNVWVLLNARYSPYYKQVPEGPFKVSKQEDYIARPRIIGKPETERACVRSAATLRDRGITVTETSRGSALRCEKDPDRTVTVGSIRETPSRMMTFYDPSDCLRQMVIIDRTHAENTVPWVRLFLISNLVKPSFLHEAARIPC